MIHYQELRCTGLANGKQPPARCPDCGEEMTVETNWIRGSWIVTVTCAECGTVDEFEADGGRNEATIRY